MASIRTALWIAFLLLLTSRETSALIINIDATVSGCTACSGGPTNADVALGTVVSLISPVVVTLGPGTYTITNAATVNGVVSGANPTFLAYDFQTGNPTAWAWAFLVATDNGNGTGTMLKADYVNGTFVSQAAAASATGIQTFSYSTLLPSTSTAGFVDTLTLSQTTTLDFFIDDFALSDNSAGVALQIVPEPSSVVLLAAGIGWMAAIRRPRMRRVV